jgi:hypothetical protein
MRLIGCVVALSLAASTVAQADDKPSIVILGVVPRDHGLIKSADAMTAGIRTWAGAKVSNYRVTGAPKDVEAATMAGECSTIEPSCAVKLGAKLAADYAIAGELERRGTHQVLVLSLVDVRRKQRIRSVRETGETKADAKTLARTAYTRLIDGEVGELAIVTNAQRGEILIDGQLVGALFEGRATIDKLVNGNHQLAIRAPKFRPFEIDVTIKFATKQTLLLEPE